MHSVTVTGAGPVAVGDESLTTKKRTDLLPRLAERQEAMEAGDSVFAWVAEPEDRWAAATPSRRPMMTSADDARQGGLRAARYAPDWAAWLEDNDCIYLDIVFTAVLIGGDTEAPPETNC